MKQNQFCHINDFMIINGNKIPLLSQEAHLQSADITLESFMTWILLTLGTSRKVLSVE